MPFVGEWSTADRKKLVVLAPAVLIVFRKYQQRFSWQPESGGILLGLRRGKHLEVLFATEPGPNDRRSTFSFFREADGHAQAAQQAWLLGERRVDYLGEWHTHPQRVPIPSALDREEWRKLVMQRPRLSAVLTIVVGTEELHLELVDPLRQQALKPVSCEP